MLTRTPIGPRLRSLASSCARLCVTPIQQRASGCVVFVIGLTRKEWTDPFVIDR
jgi:hypothetical protein